MRQVRGIGYDRLALEVTVKATAPKGARSMVTIDPPGDVPAPGAVTLRVACCGFGYTRSELSEPRLPRCLK
jgi:hypothetical protein